MKGGTAINLFVQEEAVTWIFTRFFVRGDIRIETEFEGGKDLYLTACHPLKPMLPWPNTKLAVRRINTGVMIFRKSQWSIDLLDAVWDCHQFTNHFWWEQAAMMYLIGDRVELTGNVEDNVVNLEWTDRMKFIPNKWNSMHHDEDTDNIFDTHDPIIIHLAGGPTDQRIDLASRFEFRLTLGA